MNGYGCFSRYYDALTENVNYQKRARVYDEIIRKYRDTTGLVLDLACGTGSVAIAMAQLNYDVIGVDISPEMLSVAAQKASDTGHSILFLNQDMAKLDLFGTIDATICALDSINHVENGQAIQAAFKRVSLFTNTGGLFIFDVNTAYKHRQILGSNAFVYDTPEVFCCWQNSYNEERGRVDILLDFFVPTSGGLYRRESEAFSEWLYPEEEITGFLKQSGFELLEVLDGDSFLKPCEITGRLMYVARKT